MKYVITQIIKVVFLVIFSVKTVHVEAQIESNMDLYYLPASESHGGRGNWIDRQPGLYSIIEQIIKGNQKDIKEFCNVTNDTIFGGCLPLIFNLSIRSKDTVDTLLYNWHSDTIYCANFLQTRTNSVSSLLWSTEDCIFVSEKTFARNPKLGLGKRYILPQEIIHTSICGLNYLDSLFFNVIENWKFEKIKREMSFFIRPYRDGNKTYGFINFFLRTIIKDGKPTETNCLSTIPTINQVNWFKDGVNRELNTCYPWKYPDLSLQIKADEDSILNTLRAPQPAKVSDTIPQIPQSAIIKLF